MAAPVGLTPAASVRTAGAAPAAGAQPERAPWVLLPPLVYWLPTFQRSTDEGTLYAGPGNERWRVSQEMPLRGTGPDAVALVGALRADAGFAFITSTGAVYSASSALGELSFSNAPAHGYVDAAAGREHFLGIDASGRLQRSGDRGRSWQAVSVPPHSGALSEVEMLQSGAGLLLANHSSKSELFATLDDGATWREVDGEGRTFLGLVSHEDQLQPVVSVSQKEGYYQHAILDEALERVSDESRVFDISTPFDHFTAAPPDFTKFLGARAAAPGAPALPLRWVALRERRGELTWEISVTPFGELPNYRPIEGPRGCGLVAAAVASEIALVCRRPGTRKASLFVGEDDLHGFRKYSMPSDPVALHALGDAFVVQTPCDGPKQSRGPYLMAPPTWQARRVKDDVCRTHLAFTSAAEPDAFFSVAWSNSGLTLHRWRTGDPRPELVSTIAAAASEPSTRVALAREGATVVVAVPPPSVWSPTGEPELPPAGVLFRSNDAGQSFSEVALPTAFMALSLSGRRGFGVGHDGQAWMTQDFGAAWTKVWAPRQAGWRSIECNDAGCLSVRGMRVGWGP